MEDGMFGYGDEDAEEAEEGVDEDDSEDEDEGPADAKNLVV